jgi:hypothetical protein
MFARTLGLAIVAMALCSIGLQAGGGGKDKKEPAKDKKFEIPKDAVAGKVKTVDQGAKQFTITTKEGKDRTFSVDDKTEFWGPKGGDRGTGPKGLMDDTMTKGYDIKVSAGPDGKTAKNVYLPNRKPEKAAPKKDKK